MSGDIHYNETALILNFESDFTDDSPFHHALVNLGDTLINENGANYDGDGDYQTLPALINGTDDFTLECIVYRSNIADSMCLFSQKSLPSKSGRLILLINQNGYLNVFLGSGSSLNMLSVNTIPLNTETHCELDRKNNIFKLYINGNLESTSSTVNTAVENTDFYIGRDAGTFARDALGHIRAIRVTNLSRNSDSFTPPPFPFPVSVSEISGTISEALSAEKFIIAVHKLDGTLVGFGSTLTSDFIAKINTFEPVYVTLSADQGGIRKNSTPYALNDFMFPADPKAIPYYYKCIQAGTTAASEPVLPTIPGDTVPDNTVIWQCIERLIQPITHGPLIPS